MNIFEKILIALIFLVPLFFGIYFSINHQIYGVDSWYWIKFGVDNIYFTNLMSVAMWFLPVILFVMYPDWKFSSWIVAGWFMINLFSLRFLEVEYDDYLIYCFSFFVIYFTKCLFPDKDYHKIFAVVVVLGYVLFQLRGNFIEYVTGNFTTKYLENWKNPMTIFYMMPSLYILGKNKRWFWFSFLIVYFLLFTTGKMITNPIPILVFAIYLDFLSSGKFEYSRDMLMFFLIIFSIIIFVAPIASVNGNNNAFRNYCNVSTKICENTNVTDWSYGHYFAYLGYKSDNPDNYGLFCCQGRECIDK